MTKQEQVELMQKRAEEAQTLLKNAMGIFDELRNDASLRATLADTVQKDEEAANGIESVQGKPCQNCCPCGCYEPQYPCACKKCDQKKTYGIVDFNLFFYALEQSYNTANLAGDQLGDAINFLIDGIEHFIIAEKCEEYHGCKCYCHRNRNC